MNPFDVKGVSVTQDSGNIGRWTCGADVDADGTNGNNPRKLWAYNRSDTGIDRLADAGYPNQSWKNVLINNNGVPLSDGNGNFYSSTTYYNLGQPIVTRYLDATVIPYVVVNPLFRIRAAGVVVGSLCYVTYKTMRIPAVVGDVSGADSIGELSVYLAKLLGIPSSPINGGVNAGVSYECHAGVAASLVINGTRQKFKLIPATDAWKKRMGVYGME